MELGMPIIQKVNALTLKDWVEKPLKQIAPLQRGFDLPSTHLASGKYPVVYSNGIGNYHNKYMVKAPGIVTGRSGTIGKVMYLGKDFWPHNTSLWVTNFHGNDTKFIYYLYLFIGLERFSTGSGVPTLNRNDVHDFRVSLPPFHEQQGIAQVLSDTDKLIKFLEKKIEKKKLIKKGVMQALLTPKEGWEVKKLGEIANITKLAGFEYSNYFNSYKDRGEVIVLRGTNITANKLDLSDIKTIPRKTSDFLKRSKLYCGDLVFAYVGTIGPVYLVKENNRFHLGPNTSKISASNLLNSEFLFHYFTSWYIQDEIVEHTSIGAQPSLSMSKIRSFNINLPNLEEQVEIARVLTAFDNEIKDLTKLLQKYGHLRQGMMQQLLTGKIRLV
ncbi:restriction endonuclease subunit S [Algoriphagus machipongonensis]|uniref:Ribosomal protein L10 n=1 Tax=Algoriphagus machipongonensis TaxID=388413 RepID=A3HT80_9BACT|nr:restriction endonuclease subunit S [Algoriphagus machipongonensis]EAZ83048.1 ribosomal protein L10 [Algoriphagus machipongonensis]